MEETKSQFSSGMRMNKYLHSLHLRELLYSCRHEEGKRIELEHIQNGKLIEIKFSAHYLSNRNFYPISIF